MIATPRPICRAVRLLLPALCCLTLRPPSGAGGEVAPRERVVAIDWEGFDRPIQASEDYQRCAQILLNSARHADRRHFAPGEFRGYPGREQQFMRLLADAFLLKWLDAHSAISPGKSWLAHRHNVNGILPGALVAF